MYFLYSVDVHVQQNVPGVGRGDEKRVNITLKANVTLQDEEVPNYFFFVLFRAMIMPSQALEIPSLKKSKISWNQSNALSMFMHATRLCSLITVRFI